MRKLTTILAAAAAPAALAAILLGTAGSAAASTTATTDAATGGHAVTWERGVDDTTSAPTGVNDPTGNGPIWAYDTVQRQVTWTPDTATPGAWDVTVATFGTYHAFANPITGAPWKGAGLMVGEIQYVVTAPAAPSAANLPAVSPNMLRSQGIVDELFGQPNASTAVTMTGGAYNFVYEGIPGAPGGLYFQH
jgi:hypothetical protein